MDSNLLGCGCTQDGCTGNSHTQPQNFISQSQAKTRRNRCTEDANSAAIRMPSTAPVEDITNAADVVPGLTDPKVTAGQTDRHCCMMPGVRNVWSGWHKKCSQQHSSPPGRQPRSNRHAASPRPQYTLLSGTTTSNTAVSPTSLIARLTPTHPAPRHAAPACPPAAASPSPAAAGAACWPA